MELIRSAFDAWKVRSSRESLIALLESSQHPVYGTCYEILRHRQDAEDAAQRVLVEIQDGLAQVADADHFLKRLRLVAFRTALDVRRSRRRRIDRERKASDMNASAPISDDVREAVHEAMAALDEESRALIIEHYFEKSTLEEIGARRGVSGAAVWKRMDGIKARLKGALALAGLAAAASKAEACLEAASLSASPANLVTGAVLGGGIMAAKTATAAVATIVAALTFALGLGGGLAIQAARDPRIPKELPVVHRDPAPPEERTVAAADSVTRPDAGTPESQAPAAVASAEDRLKLAKEIWAQFSRPRFWKDQEAQDETLPKLKLLGPDLATYFIEQFRRPELNRDQRAEAVRLAVTCGGSEAASLTLELMRTPVIQEPHLDDVLKFRIAIQSVVSGGGFSDRPTNLPVKGALWDEAMRLRVSEQGWDRLLAMSLLTYGEPREYLPILKDAVRTESSALVRSELVNLLVRMGDAKVLDWLREKKAVISEIPLDPRRGPGAVELMEQERSRMSRVVDEAIENLERKLKK